MRNKILTFCTLGLLIVSGPLLASSKWENLFPTKPTLWSYVGDATWTLNNNEIVANNATENSFIVTDKSYSDFHLKLEFYPVDETNSGVYFRCEKSKLTAADCYEANIADKHQDLDSRRGALVGYVKPALESNTINKWNRYDIVANGKHIQIWLNGVKTANFESAEIKQGVIALQLFKAGEVRFRNVRIKEL